MVIGGDIVQKALAAGTGGKWWFTPVCFSFGWVAYSFIALVNIIGTGCLMPDPDYAVKLINLDSGNSRQNANWALGRFVRDCETRFDRDWLKRPSKQEPVGIRITVYDGQSMKAQDWHIETVYILGLACILLQLALAVIPIVLRGEWDIMILTVSGTILSQLAGSLPQWKAEKTASRKKSKNIALTKGNGSLDVIVICGSQDCWDLEALAAPNNPRIQRGWPELSELRRMRILKLGFPVGYSLTMVFMVLQSIMWLLFLVNVGAERSLNWLLIAIGLIGVFQNGVVAGMERDERQLNLKLKVRETIERSKVMDGLKELEESYGLGKHLLPEFFNSELREEEKEWWKIGSK